MSKPCNISGCKDMVEICCECKTNNYFCLKHLLPHIKKMGNHLIRSTKMELKPEITSKFLKDLTHKCRQLSYIKAELTKFCVEFTDYFHSRVRKIIDQLSSELKHYNQIKKMIAEIGEVDRDLYERFSATNASCAQVPKDYDLLKDELHSFFENNFKLVEGVKDDDDYFWIHQDTFVKIDLDTLKKTQTPIKSNITSSLNSCKLPDGTFFVNAVGTVDCFIADLEENSLSPIESCPVTTYYGVISCIDDYVYMINGYTSPMSEKFSLTNREWSKVTSSPLTLHVNTGGVVLDKICLTCYCQSNAYIYDPKADSYCPILSLAKGYKIYGYGFILTSQWAYRVEDRDEKKWKSIPYRSKDSDCCYCMMNTYVFKRGRYLYFCNCSQKLYRFDTKLIEYKLVSFST